MPIDQFVNQIVQDDRETNKLIDSWNMEKEEIIQIIVEHFREFGIFMVSPMEHANIVYKNILFQLSYSPRLRARLNKIQADIERAKAKHTRHEG